MELTISLALNFIRAVSLFKFYHSRNSSVCFCIFIIMAEL